jgi:hypothetical protein
MKPLPAGEYIITDHASMEMERRNILPELVREVLEKPEQRLVVREGREVFQSRKWIKGKRYLIRIFVEVDRSPAEVVTAYRTSRITKYWREVG